MRAKYMHYGNDCIIYDQVVCEDNIVTTVKSYASNWFDSEPKITTKVCLTNAEARRMFFEFCDKFERECCSCIYKEVQQ